MTEEALWKALHREFGIREVSVEERLLTRKFEASLKKMPGMYELIEELKARGIGVMLLTNVSKQYAEVLEQRGHYDPFELKLLSYETGLWKPDAAIYLHALEKANVRPEEAVFIDDQEQNVVAAQKLGIHGILFENLEQIKSKLEELIEHA